MLNPNVNNFLKFFIVFILSLFFIPGQVRVGEWGALTSTLEVNDIVGIKDETFLATTGGVLVIKDNTQSIITTVDGLSGVNIESINVDHQFNIWIGGSSPNGFVQIYNPSERASVEVFEFGLSSIKDIQIKDDICWVHFTEGQNTGLMKYIFNDKWEYRDSYKNYPNDAGLMKCFVVSDTMIYSGMMNGLYAANINNNIKDPNNWIKIISDFNDEISSITKVNNELLFSSENSLFRYNIEEQSLTTVNFSKQLQNANNVMHEDGNIWFSDNNKLFSKLDLEEFEFIAKHDITEIYDGINQIIVGTKAGFLSIAKNNVGVFDVKRHIPNSPSTSKFSAIEILSDGRLVGGSRSGISIYDNYGWRNILEVKEEGTNNIINNYDYDHFIADTVPFEFGEYISDIEQGPDGLLYCAIRGSRVLYGNPVRRSGGILIIDVDDPENISTIDTTYLSYYSSSGNSHYQIILDIEFDAQGNLWIVNPYCTNGNSPVHVRSPEGDWMHYSSFSSGTRISQSPCSITFDSYNRAWVSAFSASEANQGIYPNGGISVLSFSGSPYNPDDIFWKIIENSSTVWSLRMGANNKLYYLTPSGLNYFTIGENPNFVIDENRYAFFPNISFGSGSKINIDEQGNVWANSTSEGLKILLSNSTYWPDIDGFNTENSPLLSNEVMDVAFDANRNLAYIATSLGVNTIKIPFGISRDDYNDVTIFPSPFIIPAQKSMKVDNLPFNSSMLITTLNGKIIKSIGSNGIAIDGNQLSWDGRDNGGKYVSTGVYLLLIFNDDGSSSEHKITVIQPR